MSDRTAHVGLKPKVVTVQEAAQFIDHGDMVDFTGFTSAGYPRVVPPTLAERIEAACEHDDEFRIKVLTGVSTVPELDGMLAEANGMEWRMPCQSDLAMRNRISVNDVYYSDIHLSHSGPMTEQGSFGPVNATVVEAVRIETDGSLILSSSVGNSISYLNAAEKIITEVNSWQPEGLESIHDTYSAGLPPNRKGIPILAPGDRIGTPYVPIDVDKAAAIAETSTEDRNSPFKPLGETSKVIAGYPLDFLDGEVRADRLPENLLPAQSDVGNTPSTAFVGLLDSKYENLISFTEVIQDDMIDSMDAGKLTVASGTAFPLSPEYVARMNENAAGYRDEVVLRPQDLSDNPGLIRRVGLIATSGVIEADIYGNVNSIHIADPHLMNDIGGSGDFIRNARISSFVSLSLAKDGNISAIVPMVSHADHTERDAMVITTEQDPTNLRGLAPRQRSRLIIEKYAHPVYKEALFECVEYAEKTTPFTHTSHDLVTFYDFHHRFLENGSMKPVD